MTHRASASQGILPVLAEVRNVQLRIDFIGHGTASKGFSSLHGAAEVQGDKYYMCLQNSVSLVPPACR